MGRRASQMNRSVGRCQLQVRGDLFFQEAVSVAVALVESQTQTSSGKCSTYELQRPSGGRSVNGLQNHSALSVHSTFAT